MTGFLDWTIWEAKTGTELGNEKRNIALGDIKVESVESPEIRLQNLSLGLTSPFVISLARSLTPDPNGRLSGFGFSAMRNDLPAFSWEWFMVSNPQLAIKLQEAGQLGIEIVRGEIVRTDFLTDVSFRIVEMSDVMSFDPRWRINIRQGSWMRWPGSWELK